MNAIPLTEGTASHYLLVLDLARQSHVRAVQRALDAGAPPVDLIEDAEAFLSAVRGIVAVGQ